MAPSEEVWGTRALQTLLDSERRAKVLTSLVLHSDEPSSFFSAVMRRPKVFLKEDDDDRRRIGDQ